MQSSSAIWETGLPVASNSTAWALNSAVYCWRGFEIIGGQSWRLLVQNSSSPQASKKSMPANFLLFRLIFLRQRRNEED